MAEDHPVIERLQARISHPYKQIDVEPGWFAILDQMDRALSLLDPHYEVVQIKQDFGNLDVYAETTLGGTSRAEFDALIVAARQQASRTCEQCGEPGGPRVIDGWASVRCEDHAKGKR